MKWVKGTEEEIAKKYKVTYFDQNICLRKGNNERKGGGVGDFWENNRKTLKHLIKEIKRNFGNSVVV